MTDRNTHTPQPPKPPESPALWPKTDGDFTESEAAELVEHLNALAQYDAEIAQWQHNEHLRTQREIELLFRIYRPALRRYLAQHGNSETQSLRIETGQIWLEKWPAQLCIEDAAAALAWTMQHANTAVDVTIALNGSFDALLTSFMAKALPFYLHQPDVFSRTVNLRRLQREWLEMNEETGVAVPDGCKLLAEESQLVVGANGRRSGGAHTSLSERGGDDDDS